MRLAFAAFADGFVKLLLQTGQLRGRDGFVPNQCRISDGFECRQENRLLVGDGFPVALAQQAEQDI